VKSLGELDKTRNNSLLARAETTGRATSQRTACRAIARSLDPCATAIRSNGSPSTPRKISRQTVGRCRPRFRSGRPGDEGMARKRRKKAVEQMAKSSANSRSQATVRRSSPKPRITISSLLFQDARTDRQLQSAKYVLFGEDFLRKNLMFAAGAMAAAGPAAAMSLGMVNALMVTQQLLPGHDSESSISAACHRCRRCLRAHHPNSETPPRCIKS